MYPRLPELCNNPLEEAAVTIIAVDHWTFLCFCITTQRDNCSNGKSSNIYQECFHHMLTWKFFFYSFNTGPLLNWLNRFRSSHVVFCFDSVKQVDSRARTRVQETLWPDRSGLKCDPHSPKNMQKHSHTLHNLGSALSVAMI